MTLTLRINCWKNLRSYRSQNFLPNSCVRSLCQTYFWIFWWFEWSVQFCMIIRKSPLITLWETKQMNLIRQDSKPVLERWLQLYTQTERRFDQEISWMKTMKLYCRAVIFVGTRFASFVNKRTIYVALWQIMIVFYRNGHSWSQHYLRSGTLVICKLCCSVLHNHACVGRNLAWGTTFRLGFRWKSLRC